MYNKAPKFYRSIIQNKQNIELVKSSSDLYNKTKLKAVQPNQGKGQTMLDMFPTALIVGNIANVYVSKMMAPIDMLPE